MGYSSLALVQGVCYHCGNLLFARLGGASPKLGEELIYVFGHFVAVHRMMVLGIRRGSREGRSSGCCGEFIVYLKEGDLGRGVIGLEGCSVKVGSEWLEVL